jgi:hypothetical protein
MAEIAALNIAVNSDPVKQATAELRQMAPAATAAEKAAQRWGMATDAASRSADDFSRRVQGQIRSLEFERAQLTRTAAEQLKYAALKRAGVSAMSAEGQAISASVAALQAQKIATAAAAKELTGTQVAAKVGTKAMDVLKGSVLSLAAAFSIEAIISRVSDALREVADLGETADQIGITVKGLQALQFQAVQNGVSLEQLNTGIGKFSENIGKAADGDKSMIESLQLLKVKILDVHGNLLPTEDLLVQVAQRIMAIDDPARRTAAAVDFFGKAGKQLLPTLAEIAKGFDSMSAQAKAAGAIISTEAIAKLDALADSAAKSHLVMRAFFAENAAGPLTEILDFIGKRISNLSTIIKEARSDLAQLLMLAANPLSIVPRLLADTPADAIAKKIAAAQSAVSDLQGNMAIARTDRDRARMTTAIGKAQAELDALLQQQNVMNVGGKASAMPGDPDNIGVRVNLPPKGVLDPKIKTSGAAASDPYAKAVESAREYIITQQAATAAVGMSAEAAARLKHETELLNKVQGDGKTATAAQKAEIAGLAQQMAAADVALDKAKFMDDATTKATEFIAQQQIERDTLFMSAEAADAYRIAQTALNDAKAKGIELSAADVARLQELAAVQAAASEKTRQAKEIYDLARDSFVGFIGDMRQGLADGKTVWESFGNAAKNALDKIASTLLDMAAKKLFESAFGGAPGSAGGGGGGLFGGLSSWIGGLLGTGVGPGVGIGADAIMGLTAVAKGAAFQHGNVVPFARGGIVGGPTLFPMANGMGLMGEAGPEAVMPLRRGPGGRLGVSMHGGSGAQPIIKLEVTGDTGLVRVIARDESGKVLAQHEPRIVGKAVKQSTRLAPSAVARQPMEREGEWRTSGAG